MPVSVPSSIPGRTALLWVVLALAALIACPPAAGAHATFVASSPAPCDVSAEVAQVVIRFDQPLVADRSGFDLLDGDDAVVARGVATSDSLLGGTLAADLGRSLPPGDYRVAWHNVSSADSDPGRGVFGFTVGGDGAVAAPGCSNAAGAVAGGDASTGAGVPLVLVLSAGVLVIGAVAVLVVLRRRSAEAR